jgi:V8-like Glu-specific endopeptidase
VTTVNLLEREDTMAAEEIELRILALAERKLKADIEFRASELELKRKKTAMKDVDEVHMPTWKTGSGLAIVGAFITLFTAVFTNFIQGCNNSNQRQQEHATQLTIERQKFQSDLIQKAIERAEDNNAAAVNLNFLWAAGLIPDYDKIPKVLRESGHKDSSTTLPSRMTYSSSSASERDDRVPVSDTTAKPFSAICSLEITMGAAKFGMIGTGFLVSPNVVMTAGHCIFNRDPRIGPTGFVDSIRISPGQDGKSFPLGTFKSESMWVDEQWSVEGNTDYNYGVIILATPIPGASELSLASLSDNDLKDLFINICGYPVEKGRGTMWMTSGYLDSVFPGRITYPLVTGGGTSGGPVWSNIDGNIKVVGIHHSTRTAVRITDSVVANINKWIAQAKELKDAE